MQIISEWVCSSFCYAHRTKFHLRGWSGKVIIHLPRKRRSFFSALWASPPTNASTKEGSHHTQQAGGRDGEALSLYTAFTPVFLGGVVLDREQYTQCGSCIGMAEKPSEVLRKGDPTQRPVGTFPFQWLKSCWSTHSCLAHSTGSPAAHAALLQKDQGRSSPPLPIAHSLILQQVEDGGSLS